MKIICLQIEHGPVNLVFPWFDRLVFSDIFALNRGEKASEILIRSNIKFGNHFSDVYSRTII